ncbi:hypothetical protein M9458_052264, partial [Cirrhinus mrigala]
IFASEPHRDELFKKKILLQSYTLSLQDPASRPPSLYKSASSHASESPDRTVCAASSLGEPGSKRAVFLTVVERHFPGMSFRPCVSGCGSFLTSIDGHDRCLSCLGLAHAEAAFVDGSCAHCERVSMAALRSRLSFARRLPLLSSCGSSSSRKGFTAATARHLGDLQVTGQNVPPSKTPRASAPPRSPVVMPKQTAPPPKSGPSVSFGAPLEDKMSISASEGEQSADEADVSVGRRPAAVAAPSEADAELSAMLLRAAEGIGLEVPKVPPPDPSRLNDYFLGTRSPAPPRSPPVPFFPEVHDELVRAWRAPYSARSHPVSSSLATLDGGAAKGYVGVPQVERAVAVHLCPQDAATWRGSPRLPSKACRLSSALAGRADCAASQAATALHAMATLQVYQAKALKELHEGSPDQAVMQELRAATDFALRATKVTARSLGTPSLAEPAADGRCRQSTLSRRSRLPGRPLQDNLHRLQLKPTMRLSRRDVEAVAGERRRPLLRDQPQGPAALRSVPDTGSPEMVEAALRGTTTSAPPLPEDLLCVLYPPTHRKGNLPHLWAKCPHSPAREPGKKVSTAQCGQTFLQDVHPSGISPLPLPAGCPTAATSVNVPLIPTCGQARGLARAPQPFPVVDPDDCNLAGERRNRACPSSRDEVGVLQPLLHRAQEERWVTTDPGSSSFESVPSQAAVQNAHLETHSFLRSTPGLVCSHRPEGRLLSRLDIASTQTFSTVSLRGLNVSIQGAPIWPVPVSPHLYEGRGGRPDPLMAEGHSHSQLSRRLAHHSSLARSVVRTQGPGALTPQPSGPSGQPREEQTLPSVEDLLSRHGAGLGQHDSLPHQRAHAVSAELSEIVQTQDSGPSQNFSEAPGAYGSRCRSNAARPASYETASALATRSSPEMGMAPWHTLDWRFPAVSPPMDRTPLLDRTPSALAHQLPGVASCASCAASLSSDAPPQACACSHRQHCDCSVHQPSGWSSLPSHVATRPPFAPVESDAAEIAERRSHTRRAQPCSRSALTAAHPSWRMATPSPDSPADLELIRQGPDRSVCLPRILPWPALLLPRRGSSRQGRTGAQLASGAQVRLSPSEPPCTDPVQDQGGRGAGSAGCAVLAHPDLVCRPHAPRGSPSLEDSPEEGPSFSGDGHNLAPASRPVEPTRVAPGRDMVDLSVALQGLRGPPFEPLVSVELKFLSLKTALLTALASIKRVGDLQAFSVNEACLEFGPADSHVVLRPRPGYVPKVPTTPFRDQVVNLQALPPEEADPALALLCPVCALRIYVDRIRSFRRSEQLFVCFGGQQKGNAVSKQRLAHWVVDAISLEYESQGEPCPLGVRAHSTRSVASSYALAHRAAGWATPNTFARFYNLRVETASSRVLRPVGVGLQRHSHGIRAGSPSMFPPVNSGTRCGVVRDCAPTGSPSPRMLRIDSSADTVVAFSMGLETTEGERLGYVRNPRSLKEGTETLHMGTCLSDQSPLSFIEKANEIGEWSLHATPLPRTYGYIRWRRATTHSGFC